MKDNGPVMTLVVLQMIIDLLTHDVVSLFTIQYRHRLVCMIKGITGMHIC